MSHLLNTPLLIPLASTPGNPIPSRQAGSHHSFVCSVVFLQSWRATSVNSHLSKSLLICEIYSLYSAMWKSPKPTSFTLFLGQFATCSHWHLGAPSLQLAGRERLNTRALSESSALRLGNPCLQRKNCYAWASLPANICPGPWVPVGCCNQDVSRRKAWSASALEQV